MYVPHRDPVEPETDSCIACLVSGQSAGGGRLGEAALAAAAASPLAGQRDAPEGSVGNGLTRRDASRGERGGRRRMARRVTENARQQYTPPNRRK